MRISRDKYQVRVVLSCPDNNMLLQPLDHIIALVQVKYVDLHAFLNHNERVDSGMMIGVDQIILNLNQDQIHSFKSIS